MGVQSKEFPNPHRICIKHFDAPLGLITFQDIPLSEEYCDFAPT